MNKKNIGVIVTSSVLVGAALGGGIVAVTQAEDRSNAYAPTTLQKQRLSLLGTFLNDDHFKTESQNQGDIGNPFALYSKAKISEIVKGLLKGQPEFLKDLGYTKPADFPGKDAAGNENINIIHTMSILRLEKNKDTILVMLNDKNGNGYKNKLLKLNMDIKYDAADLQKWGSVLSYENIMNPTSTVEYRPFDFSKIAPKVQTGLTSKDKDIYLASMSAFNGAAPDPDKFIGSVIQSLILWKAYKIEPSAYPKTLADLKTDLNSRGISQDVMKRTIQPPLNLLKDNIQYFPSSMNAEPEAQIIDSNMDLIKTFNIDDSWAAGAKNAAGTSDSMDVISDELEISTIIGLELLPDAAIENGKLVMQSNEHREYSPFEDVKPGGEENYAGKSAFESALDNYEVWLKEDK